MTSSTDRLGSQHADQSGDGTLPSESMRVAIIGGGAAGLYTALLLQREGINFHIFEGTNRVGGRIYTHHFDNKPNQYFEAGAMRIPQTPYQNIFFDLVKYLNTQNQNGERRRSIELIRYVLTSEGNEVNVNGTPIRPPPGPAEVSTVAVSLYSTITPAQVEWKVPPEYQNRTAGDLMRQAIEPFQEYINREINRDRELKNGKDDCFKEAFWKIVELYDDYYFRYYLSHEISTDIYNKDWTYPTCVIDFLETLTSQTNQFALSFPELLMQNMDFGTSNWSTIKGGMSNLSNAMASLVGYHHITFGARVAAVYPSGRPSKSSLDPKWRGPVNIDVVGYNGKMSSVFDKVVFAIPPAALRMIELRPRWSTEKEMAIRSINFGALYKMGLRFKTRFWEKVEPFKKGGQDTTDLPIRWIVYPSNGIGDKGHGVLLVYAWTQDATVWLPLSPIERRSLALCNLEQMYGGRLGTDSDGDPITVASLLIETFDAVWSASTATGDATFLPGQFKARFEPSRKSENDTFYFAGEHNSYHHTWIAGAAESALWVVRDLLQKPDIPPLTADVVCGTLPPTPDLGKPKVSFMPNDPLMLSGHDLGGVPTVKNEYPGSLGDGNIHHIGVELRHLQGLNLI